MELILCAKQEDTNVWMWFQRKESLIPDKIRANILSRYENETLHFNSHWMDRNISPATYFVIRNFRKKNQLASLNGGESTGRLLEPQTRLQSTRLIFQSHWFFSKFELEQRKRKC